MIEALLIKRDPEPIIHSVASSEANPLKHFAPPVHEKAVTDLVLVEAASIKETLSRIYERDPTARKHVFSFTMSPENVEMLRKNGFIVRYARYDDVTTYTEVEWHDTVKPVTLVPIPPDM